MSLFGLHIQMKPERCQEIYDNIVDISAPTVTFYVMVALSTTIAAYGLLANSTAVVIGAMLVAPLMGAIFGMALGISSNDQILLWRSTVAAVLGASLAILLGAIIGSLPLRMPFGTEIFARTKPTIYDLIIALASGLAGAYALVNEKVSPALPGVAIATALVPPLTTCGLCLSIARWDLAFGAFLLFLANFLAIEIAAAIIFNLFDLTSLKSPGKRGIINFLKNFWLKIIILIFVALFMTETLRGLIVEQRFERHVRSVLRNNIDSVIGARLSDMNIEKKSGSSIEVMATVLTHYEFTPSQIDDIEKDLKKQVDSRIELIIRSLISKDSDKNGPVFISEEEIKRNREELLRKEEEIRKHQQAQEEAKFLQNIAGIISKDLHDISGAQITDIIRGKHQDSLLILVTVQTPEVIRPELIASIDENIQKETGKEIYLVIRSIITVDADAEKFVYEKEDEVKPQDVILWETRLEMSLKNQLRQIKGVSLIEYHYVKENKKINVFAIARTPVNIKPEQVKKIEQNLRKYISPQINLVVRSVVGTDTGAAGYIPYYDESKFSTEKKMPK
ncbi:MAG: TIGR00341 family protein [Candidatus Eremiobacterota bacterium]